MKLYSNPHLTKITEEEAKEIFKREGVVIEEIIRSSNYYENYVREIVKDDLTLVIFPHTIPFLSSSYLSKVVATRTISVNFRSQLTEHLGFSYDKIILVLEF